MTIKDKLLYSVRKDLEDFAVLYVTDDATAKLCATKSLVK